MNSAKAKKAVSQTGVKAKQVASTKQGKQAVKYGAIGLGSLAGFFFLRSAVRKAKKKGAENRIDDIDVQAALQIRAASNPSGMNWMADFDGTDFEVIKEAVSSVNSFNNLAKEYKNLYSESLLDRLRSELNQNELAEILAIIKTKTNK